MLNDIGIVRRQFIGHSVLVLDPGFGKAGVELQRGGVVFLQRLVIVGIQTIDNHPELHGVTVHIVLLHDLLGLFHGEVGATGAVGVPHLSNPRLRHLAVEYGHYSGLLPHLIPAAFPLVRFWPAFFISSSSPRRVLKSPRRASMSPRGSYPWAIGAVCWAWGGGWTEKSKNSAPPLLGLKRLK